MNGSLGPLQCKAPQDLRLTHLESLAEALRSISRQLLSFQAYGTTIVYDPAV